MFLILRHFNVIIVFPSAVTYDNDIALIKIAPKDGRGIMIGLYIQPACLPNDSLVYGDDLDCYISGWGKTALGLSILIA